MAVPETVDAVVIGSGPNGLTAANVLADHGWDVLVLEAAAEPGGAVRSAELTVPGFVHDRYSAFYPLAAASPALHALHLEDHGLRWRRSPLVLANPTPDGPTACLSQDEDETARALDRFAPGDGDGWRRLHRRWADLQPGLVRTLLGPFPPVRSGARLAAGLARRGGVNELARFARFALLPVRRLGEEHFAGAGGPVLLAGNALHADLLPESTLSGLYGWMLSMIGQDVGFPVPEGGAGRLTGALVGRLRARGGQVRCGQRVVAVDVQNGRARGVTTAEGVNVRARRAVVADVAAPALYTELLPPDAVPAEVVADLRSFEWDTSTVKVDWALDRPIPWTDPDCRRAGTVHLADSVDHLSDVGHALATRRMPERPFVLVGQQSMTDPTRMPPGAETAWAYTHLPAGPTGGDAAAMEAADRMEAILEERAPGFRSHILGRHVATPASMQADDANLVGGALGGGTSQLHQQLIFRPTPGLGRPETPVAGLYLASASAHPGGGVHGTCGHNAARSALWHARLRRG